MYQKYQILLGTFLTAFFLSGCGATKVVPPQSIDDGVEVYLLDHGLHSTLILPFEDGVFYRWGYGDFRYYAMGEKSYGVTFFALFTPTKAALARERLFLPINLDNMAKNSYTIELERAKVYQLQKELLFIFENSSVSYSHQDSSYEYVRHPMDYHLLHNSNKVVAQWLESMGSEVSKYPILANWNIQESRLLER